MSKRYTPQHKLAVLALLDANGGGVSLTAAQAGIPERTLRAWVKDRTQRQQDESELPPPTQRQQDESELPDDEHMKLLRTYIQQTALRLAARLSADLESPILFHKVNALNGLIDRLAKIENTFPSAQKPKIVVIEYGDDDEEDDEYEE